jgi:uncharacterized repeat protein (TIGR03803 family)
MRRSGARRQAPQNADTESLVALTAARICAVFATKRSLSWFKNPVDAVISQRDNRPPEMEDLMKHSTRPSGIPSNRSAMQWLDSHALQARRTQPRHRTSKLFVESARVALVVVTFLVLPILATQIAQAQTYSVLYSFKGLPDASNPFAGLILDASGNLYGTTYFGGASYYGTAFKLGTSGKETVLYSFLAGYGAFPAAGLVEDAKGSLYGTTTVGGTYNLGTVFKLGKKGNETVLHSFRGGGDGEGPHDGLVQDAKGNFYGTTSTTVFKLNKSGKIKTLYAFTGPPDGANPIGNLVRDAAGNLYGTTQYGGAFKYYGTVFKVDKTGKETVLHSFNGRDGNWPQAGLVRDAEGNLYGTTFWGDGTGCGGAGCGTVFKLDTKRKETVVHSFTRTDGAFPVASLVRDAAGNLYGTTEGGGSSDAGTVFMLDTTGKETVLHSFGGGADGSEPVAGLLLDDEGNLYGTTSYGGSDGAGTVFKLTP